jgi:putative phosphoribosyl transferase
MGGSRRTRILNRPGVKSPTRFRDRADAGQRLAERLLHLRDADPVVLALPRGGVPVAVPIAEALEAPLELLLLRKIGAPGQPELALGAVVEGEPPQTVLNEEVIEMLGVPRNIVVERAADQLAEIERRRRLWLRSHAPVTSRGRTVIIVDDGLATGATARVALQALECAGAARRVLAIPVVPSKVAGALRRLCEEAVFLVEPECFGSVGAFYDDFRQIGDAEVAKLFDAARQSRTITVACQRGVTGGGSSE